MRKIALKDRSWKNLRRAALLLLLICLMSMTAMAAEPIRLSRTKLTIKTGNAYILRLANAQNPVKWTTSNRKVVRFLSYNDKQAVLWMPRKGTARITAQVDNQKVECLVTVKKNKDLPKRLTLAVGAVRTLKAPGKAKWYVSNKNVVQRMQTGKRQKMKIKVLSEGTCTLTAKIGKKRYTCEITAIPRVSPKVDPYIVRSNWIDVGNQQGTYVSLANAKAICDANKEYYVFDRSGKIIYPVFSKKADKIERACQWAEAIAACDEHGYNTCGDGNLEDPNRWGATGDYCCSTIVITAYAQAGLPDLHALGANAAVNMAGVALGNGFTEVTGQVDWGTFAGLKRGDILLHEAGSASHAAMYVGNGCIVEAIHNERGGSSGGQPGDQIGVEILVRENPYKRSYWHRVLRY